jgi:hypothetical protein
MIDAYGVGPGQPPSRSSAAQLARPRARRSWRRALAGATPFNSCFVDVEPAQGADKGPVCGECSPLESHWTKVQWAGRTMSATVKMAKVGAGNHGEPWIASIDKWIASKAVP